METGGVPGGLTRLNSFSGSSTASPRGFAIEMFDAQVIVEQMGDSPFEGIELRYGIFSYGDKEIGAESGTHYRSRKLHCKCSFSVFLRMVEEVLLELIQNNEQIRLDM